MAGSLRSKGRPLAPRQSERFETNAISCALGQVLDVSREGFRLRTEKKPRLKVGEVHEIVLRAGGKQVRVASRVQWLKRASLWPASYQIGFAIVDSRPGVGVAVLQFGQFGCASGGAAAGSTATTAQQPRPANPAGSSSTSRSGAARDQQAQPAASRDQAAEGTPPWDATTAACHGHAPGETTYDIPEDIPGDTPDGFDEAGAELDDLYALLQVSQSADAEEIKSAYRRLAREWHPDQNDSEDAAQVFARIASAYAVLRDPTRRRWYDEMRSRGSAA